jgi:hypothetical protein
MQLEVWMPHCTALPRFPTPIDVQLSRKHRYAMVVSSTSDLKRALGLLRRSPGTIDNTEDADFVMQYCFDVAK